MKPTIPAPRLAASLALLLLCHGLLAGCRSTDTVWVRSELYLGLARPDAGSVSDAEWRSFLDEVVSPRFPDGFTTGNTELYNNVYIVDGVVPLIEGVQGKAKAVVAWTCPQGKSQVMGLSTGHDVNDWKAEPFLNFLEDGINYLAKNPKP